MDFNPRDYCDARDPRDRGRDERDQDHDDEDCRSGVARVLRPSPITNVNETTIGTTHVIVQIIAIGTMPDGPSVIAIRANLLRAV